MCKEICICMNFFHEQNKCVYAPYHADEYALGVSLKSSINPKTKFSESHELNGLINQMTTIPMDQESRWDTFINFFNNAAKATELNGSKSGYENPSAALPWHFNNKIFISKKPPLGRNLRKK